MFPFSMYHISGAICLQKKLDICKAICKNIFNPVIRRWMAKPSGPLRAFFIMTLNEFLSETTLPFPIIFAFKNLDYFFAEG